MLILNQVCFLYLLFLLLAFTVTNFLLPKIIKTGLKLGLIEKPNVRKIQKKPMVRMGGLAIFSGAVLNILLISFFYKINIFSDVDLRILLTISISSILIFIVGFLDDLYDLKSYTRLLLQFIIAGFTWFQGIRIESIDFNLINNQNNIVSFGDSLSFIITLVWIVGLINAINWMDGIDGLASILVSIFCVFFFLLGITSNQYYVSFISITIIGSCLAFLRYNLNPSRIYMGDGGSNFLGFIVSIITLIYSSGAQSEFKIIPISFFLAIPLFDMIYVIINRVKKGVSPFYPDRTHIHHRLLLSGFKEKKVLYIISSLSIFLSIVGVVNL